MKKRICALIMGYLAGSFITSMFAKKNSTELEVEAKTCKTKGGCPNEVFFKNFIETQKDFVNTLKYKLFSSQNKTFLEEKKEEVNNIIEEYKTKGEKLFAELKVKGEKYVKDIKEKVEDKKEAVNENMKKETVK